jgi:peptidoglycan/LPS O-acetylase OafA/YrhL
LSRFVNDGVLLALIWQWDQSKDFVLEHVGIFRWSFVLLFLVVAYLTYQKACIGDVWGHLGLAIFYGNLILLVLAFNGNEINLSLLENKFLEWFGLRSYGIYLLHKPVQILIPFLLAWLLLKDLSPWVVVIISLVILFIISELSYRIVEKPIMSLGHHFKYD